MKGENEKGEDDDDDDDEKDRPKGRVAATDGGVCQGKDRTVAPLFMNGKGTFERPYLVKYIENKENDMVEDNEARNEGGWIVL